MSLPRAWLEILPQIVSTALIPLTVAGVGFYYTRWQQNLSDLRTMIDMIPAYIYAKDAHSRFTAANKLVADRMGTTPEGLIGKTDFDFYPREMAEKFFSDEQALIQSGKALIDCEEIAQNSETGQDRVLLTILPAAMRYAGPISPVW